MIEPQGPLPDEVYWKRRLLAVAAAVVALALVIALIIWASSGGNDEPGATNAAATSSTEAAAPSEAPKSGEQDNQGSAPAPKASEPTPASGTEAPLPAPAEGAEVAPCTDQTLSVVLYTDKPTYTKGDQPVFTVVVTNGGLAPCSRDVGKASQNVVVRSLDGTRTLWAAQDCAPDKTVNVQVLAPGQQVSDKITWSGTTSSPGCEKPRVAIPVGAYQAIATVGVKESAPITFNVIAPPQQ
ncbi:hypothetical protein ACFQNE_13880 [Gordonia phosphorivorans]|uniref:MucR family transcriptional regulator n=1 Tax=Gordonia phosphorivorans TaxID=1056982 RepID=A0ABV6HD69_9ACTN